MSRELIKKIFRMRANKMELKLEMFAFRHGKLPLRYDSVRM